MANTSKLEQHPDFPKIVALLASGTRVVDVANKYPDIPQSRIYRWWADNRDEHLVTDGETPRVFLEGDVGDAVSRVYTGSDADRLTPDDLLRGWKLDPTEWEIVGTVGVNRWLQNAGEDIWAYQYKARVQRRQPEVDFEDLPPLVQVKVTVKKETVRRKKTDLACAVIYPDSQISFWRDGDGDWHTTHDEGALDIARQVTAAVEAEHGIDVLVDLGDFLDATHFSRHRSAPAQVDRHGFKLAVARGQQELAARAALTPNADRWLIPGNHENRVTLWLIDNAPWLMGFTRTPDERPMLSLEWLLQTDEHGWQVADAYPEGAVWLSKNLRCIHGTVAKGVPGASAAEYLREEVNTIFGHTPRAQTVQKTIARGAETRTYIAHTPGGLMRVDGAVPSGTTGTTITGDPQLSRGERWDQGLSVVFYDPEGGTVPVIETVPIFGGRGVWRGRVFDAEVDPDGNLLK
jgi:hypothetical protein